MKKKKFLIYLLSGLIPTLIFFICATIHDYVPFGKGILNIYDSFTQYSGMLLEYGNLLKGGNIFYSWNAGLGFNFFGTLTYYAASPLNLLCLFANEMNYPFFIAWMTFLRFFLLGLSMCFYLSHKKKEIKPLYIVMFSTAYALMGYTSAHYYNYIWIDSIIMLPLVIHGLEKLLDGKKPTFYIFSLAFTILINYYIGYMICIFLVIYFLYKLINVKDKKKIIKTFFISSLLAGLMGAVVILPSYFALKIGKASLYESVDYSGVSRNITTFFYTFLSGTYQNTDQSYGPAQVYSSILVLVLTFFYFFNTKYSKKEKIATGAIILFFYLSFSVNALNYAWQFFQKPIWWQSRFSFVFSFFLINLAADTLMNIDKTNFKYKYRIILSVLFLIACAVGAYFKWDVVGTVDIHTYIYVGLSVMIFLEMMMLLDKKMFLPLIIVFTFLDISVNSFNSLKYNRKYQSYIDYEYLREELPEVIAELNDKNEYFYRFELMKDYTSNDGLYFNFHGLNYFNSARNIRPVELMDKLGMRVTDKCHVFLSMLDPAFLSLFNFKYVYGEKMDYFEEIEKRVYENPYPLSIGFMANEKIKDTELSSEIYKENITSVLSDLTNTEVNIYREIDKEKFVMENMYYDEEDDKLRILDRENMKGFLRYSFTSDGHYLIVPYKNMVEYVIDGEEIDNNNDYFIEIVEGDEVTISYRFYGDTTYDNIETHLFVIDEYERIMELLSTNTMKAKENVNGHILEGTIEVPEDKTYLFTSIEYEEGMKVYVDGKKVEYDVILDALIGLKLEPGTHTIYIDYIPKGFILGSVISWLSLITACFYLQKNKKKL